jgi:copper(I)-binding protein
VKWLAGLLVVVLGVAGLVRGAVAQSSSKAGNDGTIVGVGGEVRQLSTATAAATMTVYNSTDAADRITGAQSGAGGQTTLYKSSIVVPAHGSVALTGAHRIVITQLYSPLRAGQYVTVALSLQTTGSILITAHVVTSTGSSGSVAPSTPSGVHS